MTKHDAIGQARDQVLGQTNGPTAPEPSKLIVPMIERFMATDRAFAKARRDRAAQVTGGSAEKSG